MISGAAPQRRGRTAGVLCWLVAGSFVALGVLILVIVAHATFGGGALVTAAQGLAAALVVFAGGSAVVGVFHSWRSHPQHRKAIAFVVIITLATLTAHAYIIGTPAASTSASVTGSPSSTFSDDRLSVTSQLTSGHLTMVVTVNGGDAIGLLNVSGDGVPLTGGGFNPPPDSTSPLLPGDSTTGSWILPKGEVFTSVTVDYRYLSCYDRTDHVYGCIMDEVFYVPSAQHMLNGTQCQMNTSRDSPAYCNLEHPPLSKALMAAGMAVFGEYSTVGWRVAPALLGTFSIPLLFGIAWKVSGSKKLAALSALLLSLDVMFFSQSSAALLDIPSLFFSIAAFFAYFAGVAWWKFDRYVVAGILLGAAGLAKETAVFSALALVTYILLFEEGKRMSKLLPSIKVIVVVGLVFAGGLQVFDSTMARTATPTFVSHVSYMLSYGSSLIADKLACQPTTGYWCKYTSDPGGPPILPTDWLVYYSPVAYFLVTVTVNPGNLNLVSVGYYGITNLIETWTVFIWVPLVAYSLYVYYRGRKLALPGTGTEPGGGEQAEGGVPGRLSGELRFGVLALVMFLWAYVPYLFLLAVGRVTYPFYFVDAIPAVAMGASYWINKKWFPSWLAAAYFIAAFVFFLTYFPDKTFLPIWVRVLLRH